MNNTLTTPPPTRPPHSPLSWKLAWWRRGMWIKQIQYQAWKPDGTRQFHVLPASFSVRPQAKSLLAPYKPPVCHPAASQISPPPPWAQKLVLSGHPATTTHNPQPFKHPFFFFCIKCLWRRKRLLPLTHTCSGRGMHQTITQNTFVTLVVFLYTKMFGVHIQ
jgi:hypothetical protein